MKETIDKTITAAFTGHRRFDYKQKDVIKSRLTAAIIESYEQGFRNFISGFAQGFDMMAAEHILSSVLYGQPHLHRGGSVCSCKHHSES